MSVMQRSKQLLFVGAVGGVLSVGLVGGAALGASFFSSPADPGLPSASSPPNYSANASGLTYGSALDAISPETEPDLILVVATNGKEGYVHKAELDSASGARDFDSPEEALAWQNSKRSGAVIAVPVYEMDGKTRIGEFVIGSGNAPAK